MRDELELFFGVKFYRGNVWSVAEMQAVYNAFQAWADEIGTLGVAYVLGKAAAANGADNVMIFRSRAVAVAHALDFDDDATPGTTQALVDSASDFRSSHICSSGVCAIFFSPEIFEQGLYEKYLTTRNIRSDASFQQTAFAHELAHIIAAAPSYREGIGNDDESLAQAVGLRVVAGANDLNRPGIMDEIVRKWGPVNVNVELWLDRLQSPDFSSFSGRF
jgi:hypothetical protein